MIFTWLSCRAPPTCCPEYSKSGRRAAPAPTPGTRRWRRRRRGWRAGAGLSWPGPGRSPHQVGTQTRGDKEFDGQTGRKDGFCSLFNHPPLRSLSSQRSPSLKIPFTQHPLHSTSPSLNISFTQHPLHTKSPSLSDPLHSTSPSLRDPLHSEIPFTQPSLHSASPSLSLPFTQDSLHSTSLISPIRPSSPPPGSHLGGAGGIVEHNEQPPDQLPPGGQVRLSPGWSRWYS